MKKKKKIQQMAGFNDSIIISYLTLVQIQPAIKMPLIFLLKTKGTNTPDCLKSPGSGYTLSPDIQPVITKWSIIKN